MTRRWVAPAAAALVAGALLASPENASAHGHGKVAVHLGSYYGYGFGDHDGLGWGWGWGRGPGVWPPYGPYTLAPQGGFERSLVLHEIQTKEKDRAVKNESQPPGRQPRRAGPPAEPARPPA